MSIELAIMIGVAFVAGWLACGLFLHSEVRRTQRDKEQAQWLSREGNKMAQDARDIWDVINARTIELTDEQKDKVIEIHKRSNQDGR